MGIFSKDPAKAVDRQAKLDAKAPEQSDKARAKAMKKGVNVDGAVAVGHTFDSSADQFLVVFPDRVELVNMGKTGSLLRSGAGAETIPVNRISSAECKNKGIWSVVEVHTAGNSIEFKGDLVSGPYLRKMILDQVDAAGATTASASPFVDVTDQLRKLGELHQSGILTDEEFAAKKSELLGRL